MKQTPPLISFIKESEVVFENQKYRWDDYGHNSIVKNRIPVE